MLCVVCAVNEARTGTCKCTVVAVGLNFTPGQISIRLRSTSNRCHRSAHFSRTLTPLPFHSLLCPTHPIPSLSFPYLPFLYMPLHAILFCSSLNILFQSALSHSFFDCSHQGWVTNFPGGNVIDFVSSSCPIRYIRYVTCFEFRFRYRYRYHVLILISLPLPLPLFSPL